MTLLWYAVFGFVVALPISLAARGGFRRQFLLALSCPVTLAILVVLALVRGCPPNAHECSPGWTIVVGALLGVCLTTGWVAGIGTAALLRRARQSRSGSSASQGVR